HGDIKPQNVLVTREGRPVIIDFGTARASSEARTGSLTVIAMTPGYCPPELAVRSRPDEVGPWSDLYSWAMTVMGLAIRHQGPESVPVDANARVALARHGITDAGFGASTASALREAGLSDAWVAALIDCVALIPADRPASVELILARLERRRSEPSLGSSTQDALWPIVPAAEAMEPSDDGPSKGMSAPKRWGLALTVVGLFALTAGAAFWPTTRSSTAADSSGVASKLPERSPPPEATDAGNPPDVTAPPPPVPATSPASTAPPPSTPAARPVPAPTPPLATKGTALPPPAAPPASAPAEKPTSPRPSISIPQSPTADPRTRIQRAKAAYRKSDEAFTNDLGSIIGIHNDLRCEPDLSCGMHTCDALADKALSAAASVRTTFQDIDGSFPTAQVADRAEAALARHQRAREDMSRAETRFRESCWQPDSYDEE
ncbi:MAG: hypothetical protein HQ461_14910, partial [Deltaproteobacteria bacterium]|nr:hypothetical protein [Deltaproteobacteria bacterium]